MISSGLTSYSILGMFGSFSCHYVKPWLCGAPRLSSLGARTLNCFSVLGVFNAVSIMWIIGRRIEGCIE